MTVLDLDARRVEPYLISTIDGFLGDPPDSDFQRGYLSAMLAVYREAVGRGQSDARVIAAERMLTANQ